jgi:hypothetical protein
MFVYILVLHDVQDKLPAEVHILQPSKHYSQ